MYRKTPSGVHFFKISPIFLYHDSFHIFVAQPRTRVFTVVVTLFVTCHKQFFPFFHSKHFGGNKFKTLEYEAW